MSSSRRSRCSSARSSGAESWHAPRGSTASRSLLQAGPPGGSLGHYCAVAAFVEDEWLTLAEPQVEHPADRDRVVASGQQLMQLTDRPGEHAVDDRRTVPAVVRDGRELLGLRDLRGEQLCDLALL